MSIHPASPSVPEVQGTCYPPLAWRNWLNMCLGIQIT